MNDTWGTPLTLVQAIAKKGGFNFTLDAAADIGNTKCVEFIGEGEDSLTVNWQKRASGGDIWLNPPYSRGNIGKFMEKAAAEGAYRGDRHYIDAGRQGAIVCLVRLDPSAQWFQKHVNSQAKHVWMLPKRVKFVGAKAGYNFPLCVVIYSLWHPMEWTNYRLMKHKFDWEQ